MRYFNRTREKGCTLITSGVRTSQRRAISGCVGYNLGDWADEIEAIRLCAL